MDVNNKSKNVAPVNSELQDDMRIMKNLVSDSDTLNGEKHSNFKWVGGPMAANHDMFLSTGALLMVRIK